jgi:hypothetical protein
MVEREPKRSSKFSDAVVLANAGPCSHAVGSMPTIQAARPDDMTSAVTANAVLPIRDMPRLDLRPAAFVVC